MNKSRILNVLLSPHNSEKSAIIGDKHQQVVFKVAVNATKLEIKKAVEQLFKVKVKAVQVLNVKAKTKRRGQILGKRSGWKKAYVCLEQGHDIDFRVKD